jgi:hypothetical protein
MKTQALRALVDKSAPEATDCFVQFDHIPSNFVEMNVFIDTSPLPDRLRLYLGTRQSICIVRLRLYAEVYVLLAVLLAAEMVGVCVCACISSIPKYIFL